MRHAAGTCRSLLSASVLVMALGHRPVLAEPPDAAGLAARTGAAHATLLGKDGAPMVLIHAGDFMMGSHDGEADEIPAHRVSLEA
ncbi:MAG: hypothetical protein KGN30_10510, partial [Nitrospirota bacterium]|nr:hypothetical protein [Nitrospirota bacterium]